MEEKAKSNKISAAGCKTIMIKIYVVSSKNMATAIGIWPFLSFCRLRCFARYRARFEDVGGLKRPTYPVPVWQGDIWQKDHLGMEQKI